MKLQRKVAQWLANKTLVEQVRFQSHFERTWVMLEMEIKQKLEYMRYEQGAQFLSSQTIIKLDFQVERLTEDCWDLIGDEDTGVRMLVVDLEQATENEE